MDATELRKLFVEDVIDPIPGELEGTADMILDAASNMRLA